MTDWYAVVVGFLVELTVGIVGMIVPGLGQLAAALLGGFVAGYMAGGGLVRGGWHGLLAGALAGLVLGLVLGLGATLLGLPAGPIAPLLGIGVFAVVAFGALFAAIPSGLAGAVGGAVGGPQERQPSRL